MRLCRRRQIIFADDEHALEKEFLSFLSLVTCAFLRTAVLVFPFHPNDSQPPLFRICDGTHLHLKYIQYLFDSRHLVKLRYSQSPCSLHDIFCPPAILWLFQNTCSRLFEVNGLDFFGRSRLYNRVRDLFCLISA